VVAGGGRDPGVGDGRGHLLGGPQVGGQRLLHEERQPRAQHRELRLAVREGRHAQPHRVRSAAEQGVQVGDLGHVQLPGQRVAGSGLGVADADELDVVEAGQGAGVPCPHAARADQRHAQAHCCPPAGHPVSVASTVASRTMLLPGLLVGGEILHRRRTCCGAGRDRPL
jgi:hypothetical protein